MDNLPASLSVVRCSVFKLTVGKGTDRRTDRRMGVTLNDRRRLGTGVGKTGRRVSVLWFYLASFPR